MTWRRCKTSDSSLRTPDTMERSWPELASSRRNFLPLLVAPLAHPMGEGSGVRAMENGERTGARADVSVHLTSTSGPLQGAESGLLSLADTLSQTQRLAAFRSLRLVRRRKHPRLLC